MEQQPTEWLTPKEFLEPYKGRLGRNTLYDHIRDKTIPSVRVGHRKILIPADAWERLLQEQESNIRS